MFIDKVYNDSLIRKFIIYLFEFFKKNHFYLNKFSNSILKIEEIYDNLESVNNHENSISSENDEILQNKKILDFEEKKKILKVENLTEEEIANRKRLKRKLKRKRKKNKKNQKLKIFKLVKDLEILISIFDHFEKILEKSDFVKTIEINFTKKEILEHF